MRVCAIILAFDHRKPFLPEVIERLYELKISKIIIVDNNPSSRPTQNIIPNDKITILNEQLNVGSAAGFGDGIAAALNSDCDFFWLLDDDNLPDLHSLSELKLEWKKREKLIDANKLMLVSKRPDVFRYINPKIVDDFIHITPPGNSYLGFHYSKLLRLISNKLNLNNHGDKALNNVIEMDAAYYGGLFFHRSVISPEFKPLKELFFYWDDIEFTNRFYRNGGKIFLVPNSLIDDMDRESLQKSRSPKFFHPLIDFTPKFIAFCYIRNLLWFEKTAQDSFWIRRFNKLLVLSILTVIMVFRGEFKKWKLLSLCMKASGRLDSRIKERKVS